MPEGRQRRHATEPSCSLDDVLEGPVSAVLHTGTATYACRIGRSPKYELLRAVREDSGLKRCLSMAGSGVVEVSLLVDGEGRVEVVPLDDEAELALVRCAERLQRLRAMKLGCRWRVEVSLGAFEL